TVHIRAALLETDNVTFQLSVASDNCARVFVNGETVIDEGDRDHEYTYWNEVVDVDRNLLKPGRNVIAALVSNGQKSTDLYFDLQFLAEVLISPATPVPVQVVARKIPSEDSTGAGNAADGAAGADPAASEQTASGRKAIDIPSAQFTVDEQARMISIPCKIA